MQSWQALIFVSILSTLVFSQALAYDNPLTFPSQSVNSSSSGYARPPDLPYSYSKENGADLEIKATAYNPINLYGNVTDPSGLVHQMSTITTDKGMTELRFYASVSDPSGVYVARFHLIKGPATSELTVTGTSTNYQQPENPIALQMSQLTPLKQIADGVSPENVVCANGLVLIKQTSENSVACVRTQTADKLVVRGWGVILTSGSTPTSDCPTGQTMINGQCVAIIPTTTQIQECNGDRLIPNSYALPCMRPYPTCPNGMTFSNGLCSAWGYTPPTPPPPPKCDTATGICSSVGYAVASCSGGSSNGVVCQPTSIPCPTGLQGDSYDTKCNYSQPTCSTGYEAIQISAGSYLCQPTSPPSLSNATTYSAGQKVGAFTISIINQHNVTGYYNSPYPIERPGLGYFTIMHVGDTLNPTCDGSAPLVITAINYPDSIKVSIGKSMGIPFGGCPICLSADSMIKTLNGEVNVKDIKDGMTVWSTDSKGALIESKVIKINHVFVGDTQKIVDLQLADGRELFVSPNHPTYDGRKISDLKVGESYDNSTVKSVELVPYKYQFTYDILPDGQTGDYFANGVLVGSTLK